MLIGFLSTRWEKFLFLNVVFTIILAFFPGSNTISRD
jgi:hypothetical protein